MADQTEKILLQLELDVSQTLTNLEKAKAALAAFKTEQASINAELKKLEDAGQKGSVAFQNLERQLLANKAAQQNATTEVRNYEKQLRLAIAANEAQVGSNDQLKSQLSILTAEWNALASAGRENTDEGKALASAIDLTTQKLNEQEQSVGNFKRQVGDYGVVAKTLKQEIREATNEATAISRKFGENSQAAVDAATHVAELRKEYEDFNKKVEALNPENKVAAFGQVASSIAGGFTAAQGAMAIFGEQSEAVGATLVKLQAALAISQGIKQVVEMGDSLKNLRLIIFGATAAKETDTVVTEINSVAQVEGAVAAETLAAGEATATVATGVLSLALRALLIGSGLILIPLAVEAATKAFSIFGSDAKKHVEDVAEAMELIDEGQKENLRVIKERNDAIITETENELTLAKVKGSSIAQISDLEKKLSDQKNNALEEEKHQNEKGLRDLLQLQIDNEDDISELKSGAEKEKALKQKEDIQKQISAIQQRNSDIVNEEKKLFTALEVVKAEAVDKERDRSNRIANLNIALLKDEKQKELATERQATEQKLQELLKNETGNAQEIALIRQQSAEKIAEIERSFTLKELKEKNQLTVALTREGSLERVAAEIRAAQTEKDELLKNTKLTETQRQLIIADTNNKVRELEDQRLAIIEQHNQQEIDLELRKQQALIAIQKADAGNDPALQLAARLNEINVNLDAEIAAKQNAANKENEIAHQTISDEEELARRIKEIDDTLDAEQLAAIKQSALDIAQATHEANDQRIADLIAQKQLELDAVNPEGELQAHLDLLDAQEQADVAAEIKRAGSVEKAQANIALIHQKYAKARAQIEKDSNLQQLEAISQAFGIAKDLFKKNSAEYKAFATAEAIISTYLAATKALASSPPPYNYILMAATIAAGLAQVAKINSAEFYEGGYTGDGNPRETSTAVGRKPYTYHKREYVIPHNVLALPHIAQYVSGVIEPNRLGKTNYTDRRSFAVGGFADTFFVANRGNDSSLMIVSELQNVTDAILNQPPPIVLVEDINSGQGRVASVEQRANL